MQWTNLKLYFMKVLEWRCGHWFFLCKVSRRLLGRGQHCLERKCCCFGEIYSVCELFDFTVYLWLQLITLCRLLKKMLRIAHTYMYMLLNSNPFATVFSYFNVWNGKIIPALPIAASVCSCLSYYFTIWIVLFVTLNLVRHLKCYNEEERKDWLGW